MNSGRRSRRPRRHQPPKDPLPQRLRCFQPLRKNTRASRPGPNSPGNAAVAASVPPQRFRLPDDRPELNRDELLAEGLRIVESEHLILVTDLPLESVAELPPLADALFATLEQRLGKLAPDIAGRTVSGHRIPDGRSRPF